MANANTLIEIEAVHDAIIGTLQAKFPSLNVISYPLDRKNLTVPACIVELTEMDVSAEDDPGTGQTAVNARFEATLVINFRQGAKNPKMEVRKLAAELLAFARMQRWGCPIGAANTLGAYPDDFVPELDQYECWRVEWENIVHIGDPVKLWHDDDDIQPTNIYSGQTPKIGSANLSDYDLVNTNE